MSISRVPTFFKSAEDRKTEYSSFPSVNSVSSILQFPNFDIVFVNDTIFCADALLMAAKASVKAKIIFLILLFLKLNLFTPDVTDDFVKVNNIFYFNIEIGISVSCIG